MSKLESSLSFLPLRRVRFSLKVLLIALPLRRTPSSKIYSSSRSGSDLSIGLILRYIIIVSTT